MDKETELRRRCKLLCAAWLLTMAQLGIITGLALYVHHREDHAAFASTRELKQCTMMLGDLMRMCPGRKPASALNFTPDLYQKMSYQIAVSLLRGTDSTARGRHRIE